MRLVVYVFCLPLVEGFITSCSQRRKEKKHELFPEYLFSPSRDNLAFVVDRRSPAPQEENWNLFFPFEYVLSPGMAGAAQQQGVSPANMFTSEPQGPPLWVQKIKESRALLPCQVWNPSPGHGWYLMIQRKYCQFFKVNLANCVMLFWGTGRSQKRRQAGEKFLPFQRSAYILHHQIWLSLSFLA